MKPPKPLASLRLFSILDNLVKLFEELVVLFLLPYIVGPTDTLLHLFQGLLQHLCEARVHCLDMLRKFVDLLLFLSLYFALIIFDILLVLLKVIDLNLVDVDSLL